MVRDHVSMEGVAKRRPVALPASLGQIQTDAAALSYSNIESMDQELDRKLRSAPTTLSTGS